MIFLILLLILSGGISIQCFGLKDVMIERVSHRHSLLTNDCKRDLFALIQSLDGAFEFWGWKILDSSTKLQSGILILSDDMGKFDECINTQNMERNISGKYCLGGMILKNNTKMYNLLNVKKLHKEKAKAVTASSYVPTSLSWAGCLPSSCTSEDFEDLFNAIIEPIVPEISLTFNENTCSIKDENSEFSMGAIIAIIFFAGIFCIMILETCYDIYCRRISKEPVQFYIAFSMYTNSSKLFKMTQNSNQLECLNGLKFYSMIWVVLGHTYALALTFPSANFIDIFHWADSLHSMLLVSGTLAVDTFFVVGGTLVSYMYMQAMEKKIKFNILIYYLHRYIRLTPALGALAFVTATIYPYLGSGPLWSNVRINQEFCQENWWSTILYIQNYASIPKLCLGHGWYLAVDMQLYLVSPFILYPLRKYPRPTILGLLVIICIITGANFAMAWINHYSAILSNIYNANTNYMTDFYLKTHVRAGPWIFGIIIGYVIFEMKQGRLHFRPHKILNIFLWIWCIAALLICIFIGHHSLRTPEYSEWGNSLHIAFVRHIWSIGICWIMVACIFGYGGPIGWFLSFPVYQVFNKFAYSIYLLHYMYITLWYSTLRTSIYFSDMMMGYFFWGNMCFTCLLTYFWVLAFESPVIILEKILLGSLMKR
ncbi:hypothetical protein HHI36_011710 [Cryptolaemus montrouzieri]|uniref:Nose resistant-to-fluoxetine protein N-terminal domain-containing protein n=1 Tax=Cryptolaemus montrouzieri TaxID=559131 RepID=A0ABD2MMJ6_9CUCU